MDGSFCWTGAIPIPRASRQNLVVRCDKTGHAAHCAVFIAAAL